MIARRLFLAALTTFLIGCNGGTGGGSSQGYPLASDLASAIPADTVALGGGRLDLVRQTPAFLQLQQMLPDGVLQGVTKEFGLDLRKDIREFVIAYNGREALLLATGSFRAPDILAKVASTAGTESGEFKGKALVTRAAVGIAALSNTVLAAGPVTRLHESIDRLAQSAKLDERWAAGLRSLPAQTHLWFSGTGGATFNLPKGTNIANLDKILGSVDRILAWADLSKGLHLTAKASARDAESAKQLHTQLRGLIGMGRLSTPDNKPELLKLYDGIQTRLDDKEIDLDINIPTTTLELLLKR